MPDTQHEITKDATVRTIAIVNQKGGCGKTTTAINLAALYARRGLRTLLVDMDPQAHCAAGLGVPEARIEYSIGDALLANHDNGFDPSPLIWEVARNLYLAPSTVMLTALETPDGGLHELPDKDRRLESLLNCSAMGGAGRYDRCLIDCPPTIGLLTFNALRAAREALIPVETGFFALRGAEKQWATIQRMIAHIGRPIACHLLATLHRPQSQLACNILAALRRQFAGQILPVVIHEHDALREAASFGQPVLDYAPDSEARRDFEALADWLEQHAASPGVEIEVLPAQQFTPNGGAEQHLMQSSMAAAPNPRRMIIDPAEGSAHEVRPLTGGRAAELARRVHDLAARAAQRRAQAAEFHDVGAAEDPSAAALATAAAAPEGAPVAVAAALRSSPLVIDATEFAADPSAAGNPEQITHLYGVRQTSGGMLFVQPAGSARTLALAGDFNHWSASAHPLRFNAEVGVFQILIALPLGAYQYRLVADGDWIADPHNTQQALNSYGEPNSVFVVT